MFSNLQTSFEDVENHWANDSIQLLIDKNIIRSDEEDFRPNDNITRAEFTMLLASAFDLNRSSNVDKFTDVNSDDSYYEAVMAAADAGLINGSEGLFRPNAEISRQELAVILDRYLKLDIDTTSASFIDESEIAVWATNSVEKIKAAGIINGYKMDNARFEFRPNLQATRGESAQILSKILGLK
jgi:hypothetical protein